MTSLLLLPCLWLQLVAADDAFFQLNLWDVSTRNAALSLTQDASGLMWIGANDGLLYHDGARLHRYASPRAVETGLDGARVLALARDPNAGIWIGTDIGLFHLLPEQGTLKHYRADHPPDSDPPPNRRSSERLPQTKVWCLYFDSHARLWVGTESGLARFHPETETFTLYQKQPDNASGLLHAIVYAVVEDLDGALWIGTGGSLQKFDPERETFDNHIHASGLDMGRFAGGVYALRVDATNRIWAGVAIEHAPAKQSRLIRLSADRQRLDTIPVPTPTGPSDKAVRALEADGRGGFWLALNDPRGGGLYRLDPENNKVQHVHPHQQSAPSLMHQSIQTMTLSARGRLWIGTMDQGIFVLDRHRALFHPVRPDANRADSLVGRQVWGMAEDENGRLWISSVFNGLERWDPATNQSLSFANLPDNAAPTPIRMSTDLYRSQNGQIYLAAFGKGLLRLNQDETAFEQVFPNNDNPARVDLFVRAIRRGPNGALWLATTADMVLFDPESGLSRRFDYPWPAEEQPFIIRAVSEPRHHSIYIAARDQPLLRFDTTTHRFDPPLAETPRDLQINGLHLDAEALVWIATSKGLVRYDPASAVFRNLSGDLGLPDASLWSLGESRDGSFWLHGPGGLWQIQKDWGTPRSFRLPAGFQARLSSNTTFYQAPSGRIYLGGNPGFVYFDPEAAEVPARPSPVLLTGLHTAFDERRLESPLAIAAAGITDTGVTLPFDQTDITLHFAAPDSNEGNPPSFSTFLKNHDSDWRPPSLGNVATYSRLKPGRYEFQVKARNADGVWRNEPFRIPITVLPPWWQTTAARLGFVLAAILLLVAGDRFRANRVLARARADHQQREAETALKAAQYEAKAVAAEAEALRQENERKNLALAKARELEEANSHLAQQAEALRRERETTERQAQELVEQDQLKSRFFANISHELRTPLALILPSLVDLKTHRHGPLPEGYARLVEAAHHQGNRLLRLINQLLDLAKLEAHHMPLRARHADLTRFLQNMVTVFEPAAAQRGIALRFTAAEDVRHGIFEAEKLEKVIANLLSNALKFTGEGGKIKVALAREPRNGADWAVIQVKDTGIGMDPDEQNRVFDRFYQVGREKNGQQGTGLGLSLVRELTERHHGTVTLQSEPGFGTTFTLYLPLEASAFAAGEIVEDTDPCDPSPNPLETAELVSLREVAIPTPAAPQAADDARPLILLADDHADFRAYLAENLARRFRVAAYATGAEALAAVKKHAPDLVLSDVTMPDMDGFELCHALKSEADTAHLPVILLTAKASDQSKREGLALGADAYLAKPVEMAELVLRMEGLIETRRSLRDRYSKELVLGPKRIVADSADEQWLRHLREVGETHLADADFSVARLAEEIGLSRRQLQRKLNEVTGLSPSAFLRSMRLQRAADLLQQQAGTVAEVAYAAGFKNPDHFSRVFSQEFGTAPSKFAGTSQDR